MKKIIKGLFWSLIITLTVSNYLFSLETDVQSKSPKEIKAEANKLRKEHSAEIKKIKNEVKDMKKQAKDDENLIKKKALNMKEKVAAEKREAILKAETLENKAKTIRNNAKIKEKKELSDISTMLKEANRIKREADSKADAYFKEAIEKSNEKKRQAEESLKSI